MKNQLKKSLSLIMAVFMLLSCWVWVAPEKEAFAADASYSVTLEYDVKNQAPAGGHAFVYYYPFNADGTLSTTRTQFTDSNNVFNGGFFKEEDDTYGCSKTLEGIPGWPCEIFWQCNAKGADNYEVRVTTVKINGITVAQSDDWVDDDGTADKTRNFTWKWDGSGASDSMVHWRNWTKPTFTTLTSIEVDEAATLGKLPNGASITTQGRITGGKDQYGVDLQSPYFPSSGVSYTVLNSEGSTVAGASASGSGKTATITLTDDVQKSFPAEKGGTLTLRAIYNNTTVTKTFNFSNPEYTMTFNSNGGKIGEDENSAVDSITRGGVGSKMYYGSEIGKAPAYAVKAGKTFMGFYDVKNADATGKAANFSGNKFVDYPLDNYTKVDTNGDKTWYAAWQSTPITATFMTADNQLIATLEGRYDNNLAATNMYNGISGINAALKVAYTDNGGKGVEWNGNNPVYKDGATTYTFSHWRIIEAYNNSVLDGDETTNLQGDVTFQAVYKNPDAAKYTVAFYNTDGSVITSKNDYNFRDDVIVPSIVPTKATDDKYEYTFDGWAKRLVDSNGNLTGPKFYAVDENGYDENGASISYTSKDAAEFTVRGNASYVPVFKMSPREYSVTFKYTVDGGATESIKIDGYNWDDSITAPESIKDNYTHSGSRHFLTGWKLEGAADSTAQDISKFAVDGNKTLVAVYGRTEMAKYTINFYDKDGKLIESLTDVEDNSTVTAPAIDEKIDTDTALYTFVAFKDKNGNVYSTTATADADYYAEYTEQVYANLAFYNDGVEIYALNGKEAGMFIGDVIPAFDVEAYGIPVKAEDNIGTYTFAGWKDSAGNDVVPGEDKLTDHTYLNAQFTTNYKNYTVKFLNDDGTVVSEKTTYHYGDPVEIPETNPTKASDESYIYDFRAWSPEVSEVCYGNATYTATYRRTPQYYKVTWLNDNKAVLTESNYTYNAKIQQAVVNSPVGYEPAQPGYTWAFKEWIQCNADGQPIDANGNVVADEASAARFVRGMRMGTEQLYFYPVFEEVANVLTVTFYKEDGITYIGEAKIPYGEALADYADAFSEKAPKASDDNYHYIIEKWVNVENGADVTDVTADVSVKPEYTAEEHNKQIYELIQAPTCTETGLAHMKCDVPECTDIDYNVVLDVIPDEANPTGQIYVGTDKWTLEDYESGIDYNDVKYVGPNTNVIVNAEDTGSRSPQNPLGELNRGVGRIDYYVSAVKVDDPSAIQTWNNVYDFEAIKADVLNEVLLAEGKTMQDYINYGRTPGSKEKAAIDSEVNAILATYNANATGVLSNLNLANGEEYIIYIRVSDREVNGQSNKCYFSSGKIHYGTKAAEISVTGDGYGTKFCADATISVNDDTDGFKVYLDGEEITLTEGKYLCTEAGVHNITVVDKNGNKSTKTFEIKGNHTYRNYTVAATCENAGSRYDLCTLCGHKANETVLPALGHSYTVNYVEKAPDCINDGYRTYTCDNNCGTKLVLNPTDDAAKLAQAKKYVEPAEGATEGTWEALTADDLKHLKATGVHTYAKELDKDGNETENDAWVIDKAATCTVEGSKHKDCVKCGERVTDVVPVDKENGHKFYRDKVTKEPTCTEKGERTKTCRYCGEVEHVEDIPALGHTAGEYRIIKAATCTEAGEKVLSCSVCGVDIGEADKDGNYAEEPVTVTIPALDHAWAISGAPYKGAKLYADGNEVTDDEGNVVEVWYQKYVCANDSTHEKAEELEDYVEPVEAIVTFKNGEADHKVISGYVGNTITVAQLGAEPTKAEDATYKYTFSHWATKNADGSYTEVKFPIEVKGDATYYAVFAEKYINYTITYYQEDGTTQYKKVGYLHNGVEYDLVDGPAKAETWQYTYKFAGWAMYVDKVDEEGNQVLDDNDNVVKELKVQDKVTINGANVNLFATYEKILKKYAVTYAYTKNDILETFAVDAGASARECAIAPVKAADSKYHYDFDGWNRAAQLVSVESNVYTTPNFKAEAHEFTVKEKTPADCTANQVITKTCECGYSYDEEVKNTALGHLWGNPVAGEDGKNVVTCTRGCGVSQEDTRTYTVKFFVNAEDDKAIKTVNYIPWGTKLTSLPNNPTKAPTATEEYTFKGWAVKGTTVVVSVTELEIKENIDFVAVFEAKTREYTVIFAYDAYNVIEVHEKVPAGTNVTFGGTTPTKAPDANHHYTFSKWSGSTENIQSDVYVTAVFTAADHTYTETNLGEATCQNGKGTRYYCDCNNNKKLDDKVNGAFVDYYYDVTGKPLPHDFEVVERKEATPDKDGYIKYACKNCTETKTEVLKYVDNEINIQITVTHNGSPESGIQVEILEKSASAVPVYATTNANGIAKLAGVKGTAYACYVTINGEKIEVALTADANGNLTATYAYSGKVDCSCACHRDNFWGAIFRFFHKIIKLFTGEFKCCGNPDPMYG